MGLAEAMNCHVKRAIGFRPLKMTGFLDFEVHYKPWMVILARNRKEPVFGRELEFDLSHERAPTTLIADLMGIYQSLSSVDPYQHLVLLVMSSFLNYALPLVKNTILLFLLPLVSP